MVFCFGSFIVPLQNEFGWSIGAITFGATLISLMIIVGSVAAGYIVDRVDSRTMVLWSIPLFAAGMAALSQLGPNIAMIYGGLVLAALLGLGIWPVTYNRATASWSDKRRGLGVGLANGGVVPGAD